MKNYRKSLNLKSSYFIFCIYFAIVISAFEAIFFGFYVFYLMILSLHLKQYAVNHLVFSVNLNLNFHVYTVILIRIVI